MHLDEKYEALEEIAGLGGAQDLTVPAWERSSGRLAYIHILAGGYNPENNALLAAVGRLAAEHKQYIFGAGDHLGHPYVVTQALPWGAALRNWVASVSGKGEPAASPVDTQRFRRAGIWKIPIAANVPDEPPVFEERTQTMQPALFEPTRAIPTVQPPAAAIPASRPDDSTRLIQTGMRVAPAAEAPVPPAHAASGPGEFTRMMQAANPGAEPPAPVAPAPAPEPVAPGANGPGEFTRMMLAANPAAEPGTPVIPEPAPVAPAANDPDEFARMIQAGKPAEERKVPVAPPAPTAPSQAPDELTRMIRAAMPAAAPPVVPAVSASGPLEFTGGTQAWAPPAEPVKPVEQSTIPLPAPPAAPSSKPGAFTRMMQAGPGGPSSGPGEFTRAMPSAAMPASEPPAATPTGGEYPWRYDASPPPRQPAAPPSGMGEFTRMFQPTPQTPAPVSPPRTSLPGKAAPEGEFTRMMRLPANPSGDLFAQQPARPESDLFGSHSGGRAELDEFSKVAGGGGAAAAPKAASAPKPAAAAPAAVAPKSSFLPLFLILGALLVVAIVLILVFARSSG